MKTIAIVTITFLTFGIFYFTFLIIPSNREQLLASKDEHERLRNKGRLNLNISRIVMFVIGIVFLIWFLFK